MKSDRYQDQTRMVKLYRWLRWKPQSFAVAIFRIVWWALRGCKPTTFIDFETDGADITTLTLTRRRTISMLWGIEAGLSDFRMKHYYTSAELKEIWKCPGTSSQS